MYEDCVEKFNCNRYPGHCNPVCYRPIGQHNEPGVNSYKCCTCFPEVVEVFPMDRIWEGPAGRDGKDGSSLEFAWEGTRLKVRVKGTEEWVYSTSLLGMQGPKGDTGEKGETGAIGPRGYTGAPGQDGDPGADGNGVDYVELHSSSGIIKTYRMHFTDGTYFDFTVTDGINGINGQDGEGVVEGGTTGQVLKKKSNDDFDTEWVNYAYDDLSGRPRINNITLSGNKSLADLGIKQTYNKSDVGLGNVDNVRQYSVNNPPPYPVTSVNGQTGTVVIDTHDDLIPTQASSSNQLADKNFVNSSVGTATATFRGTYDSLAELEQVTADENDYGFVVDVDSDGNTVYNRYKYASGTWTFEYALNNSSFTAAQWEAIQSGITDDLVTKLQGIEAGAEVNIVEGLKIGNVTQQVSNKIMQINPDTTPMQGSNNVIDSNAVYEVEKLLPTDRESGENVDIDNAQPYKVLDIVADGKYQQNTTSGKNLNNQQLELGTISTAGTNTQSTTNVRSIGYINVDESTTYTISQSVSGNIALRFYMENETFISVGTTSASPNTFTTPTNCKKIRFVLPNNDNTNTLVQIEQGSSATSYEPYTGGIPSPSPAFPQTITQVTSATWNRVGNNLCNAIWSVNKTSGSERWSVLQLTTENSGIIWEMNATYYIRVFMEAQSNEIAQIYNYSYARCDNATKTITFTGTIPGIRVGANTLQGDIVNEEVKVMVAKVSFDTYEPYQGQTIPIDLDGNEVCAASNTIKDKLLVDRYGNVALQKNVGKAVLTGNNTVSFQNAPNQTIAEALDTAYFSIPIVGGANGKNVKSNFWDTPYATASAIWGNAQSTSANMPQGMYFDSNNLRVRILKSTLAGWSDSLTRDQKQNLFKTWLSSNNAIVYYELATPTIIPLPKLSILPTTLKGINHIWVDTNLGITDIEVEYVEDLSLAIPASVTDLTDGADYVKFTDYAGSGSAGVIKVNSQYMATAITPSGTLQAATKTYAQYQAIGNDAFIGKGTLENVLTERIGTIETALTTLDVGGGI